MRAALILVTLGLAACNLVPPDLESSVYDPDGDGIPWPEDCDSSSADRYPGAAEVWYDGIDQDCGFDDDFDQDGDGFVPAEYEGLPTVDVQGSGSLPGGDCWDEPAGPEGGEIEGAEINPAASESWYDGVDQDCDGASDFDQDADGFDHLDHDGDDCDDEDATINPDAAEIWYDGVDQDCDENDCDQDGDGLEADPEAQGFCIQEDCDDTDPEVGGSGTGEIWYDGIDQDCDGNDGDQDGDGYWAADYEALVAAAGGTPLAIPAGYGGDCWDEPVDVGGLPTDFEAINGYSQVDADEVHPGASDTFYDGIDQDCEGDDDFDADGDGAATDALADRDGGTGFDCDDSDPGIGPGAIESWYDGVDQTCDGNDGDQDGDGYWDADYATLVHAAGGTPLTIPSGYEGDCDDLEPSTFPSAPEYCDFTDSDCDGSTEDPDALDSSTWYADTDGDGWGDAASAAVACLQPSGYVADSTDCDDSDAAVSPAAGEICDGVDDDCDGLVDQDDPSVADALLWVPDADLDGYGDLASTPALWCLGSQPADWTEDWSDCDDSDAAVFPGATELCNGADDDCDGTVDEDDAADATTWYSDADGDGYGLVGTGVASCTQPSLTAADDTDCDDTDAAVNPGATEIPGDGIESDCDGLELCYQDLDGDAYGTSTTIASGDTDCIDPTEAYVDGDCDDGDAFRFPGATEAVADGVDQDCDGLELCYQDADLDGYGGSVTVSSTVLGCSDSGLSTSGTDCDDGDAAVHPGASEGVADGVDSDCDGGDLCWYDADFDGYGSSATVAGGVGCASSGESSVDSDCDDGDSAVYPGAVEAVADGVDQDCDGGEICYADSDGDGFGSATTVASADTDCSDSGETYDSSDCDDSADGVYPGASEAVADGVDQDCDGGDTCYSDGDGDGHGTTTTTASADTDCDDLGESANGSDCDDSDAAVSPGASELCNGVDDDCDGTVDEDDAGDAPTWYADLDGDAWGDDGSLLVQCDQPSGFVIDGGDCDDADSGINPGASEAVADGVDQDCDGVDLCYEDTDGDGFGSTAQLTGSGMSCTALGESTSSTDCDDSDSSTYPGAAETCDGADDDCDGTVDEDSAVDATTWYLDLDGDGFGDSAVAHSSCTAPSGYVDSALGADCDDADASTFPGAEETCDGADDDCDGTVDEDDASDASTWYQDSDADGYGSSSTTTACSLPSGYASVADDCDDGDPAVNPGEVEICSNGKDDDCDGLAEGCTPEGDIGLGSAHAALWGEDADDLAGWDVAWAGDVDADGYDDVIVGARESGVAGIFSGSAYLVLGPISADASLSTAAAILRGETYGDYAGSSVAGLGDIDGDGYDDLLVGATGQDAGGGNSGLAYLLLGPVSGTFGLGSSDARLIAEDSGDQAGWSVAGAGDVDGDGLDDLLVGAYGSDLGGNDSGAAYLLHGPTSGDVGLGSAGARLIGESIGDDAGNDLAGAGDVDGDGFDDLIIGAPGSDLGGSEGGVAYLIYGAVSGDLDLSAADARLYGTTGELAGWSVAGAGDVDGDGLDDLLVGAPDSSISGSDTGTAYLLLGPVSGDVALSTASARLFGEGSGDQAGWSVAGGDDVDGDGFDDLLVGATYEDSVASEGGATYLLLGPVSGDLSLADADARLLAQAASELVGSAVSLGGDANADGYGDMLVGAIGQASAGSEAGAVYLVLGGGF